LEKDKEKRYQTAWEMQFDIDTYLASCEFTPSNIHLSNFLKQIFGDEIEREKEILLKNREAEESEKALAAKGLASAHEHDEEVLELEDVGGRALTDGSLSAHQNGAVNGTLPGRPASKGDGEVRLRLSSTELEALRRIADAHKTTVDQVARELLRSHLKWS
ncbi:MAG: hypothetical protein IT382_13280, partial [Deltaproteobacteria bacterium]|nr:hypothetical protein [Deltaproteobacteria bacterium]